jgi:imidazolonepropionase-like amidohydrolase
MNVIPSDYVKKLIAMKNTFLVLIWILFSIAAISAQTTAFVGVNVIPMDKERVLQNQTVLVRDGIIVEVGKKVKIPKDAQIIDAKGKYLIPGLVDMHTHLLSDGDDYPDSIAEDELKVMVANGVTTIRFMIGTKEQLVLREKSAKGEIIAPTIYSASPHLTGKKQGNDFVVTTEQQAREAVRQSKQAGYDFIKITTFIDAKVYEAAVDEAARQNIRVVGHADSRFVGLQRALKAKQQIEHLDGYLEAVMADNAPNKDSVSDLYIYNVKNWASLDYIDENKIAEVAKATVAANPFVDPTQHFMKNTFGLPRSEESIKAQPDFRFYPKKVQDAFLNFHKKTKLNEIPIEKRAKWISVRNKIIKAIYDAGGKIMTGSDTPEFLWLYGFTMHRELKALSDAGLSNYAVLEAATKNPSMFFSTSNKVGTIEKDRRADLILLDANPLENISNTEKRSGVMLKGKYYTQPEMNKWLDEIAPKIQNSLIEAKTEAK